MNTGSGELLVRTGLTWHPAPEWDLSLSVEVPLYQNEVPLDRDLLLHASVTGWAGDHPQLEVLGFEETSGE